MSILTLYMSMTGGQNWGIFYEALTAVPGGELSCILFILYVTFAPGQQRCFGAGVLHGFRGKTSLRVAQPQALFAVVNIVTGVFESLQQRWMVFSR